MLPSATRCSRHIYMRIHTGCIAVTHVYIYICIGWPTATIAINHTLCVYIYTCTCTCTRTCVHTYKCIRRAIRPRPTANVHPTACVGTPLLGGTSTASTTRVREVLHKVVRVLCRLLNPAGLTAGHLPVVLLRGSEFGCASPFLRRLRASEFGRHLVCSRDDCGRCLRRLIAPSPVCLASRRDDFGRLHLETNNSAT